MKCQCIGVLIRKENEPEWEVETQVEEKRSANPPLILTKRQSMRSEKLT